MSRPTSVSREISAGCRVCHGNRAAWTGKNAQAVAAKHHDATNHETWVDVVMAIRYGGQRVPADADGRLLLL
jgi:hypothetical protein